MRLMAGSDPVSEPGGRFGAEEKGVSLALNLSKSESSNRSSSDFSAPSGLPLAHTLPSLFSADLDIISRNR
jgi:hypothetical protein